jgi:hypothetical protein
LDKTRHVYTAIHDIFLANKLSDPRLNEILRGPSNRNSLAPPKTKIHHRIATEFNTEFSTTIGGAQIKNKIASMQKLWKDTHRAINVIGNGDLDEETLRNTVLGKCPFYYILEPVWGSSWSPAPRKLIESTDNLTDEIILDAAPSNDDGDDGDDDSDSDGDGIGGSRDKGETPSGATAKRSDPAANAGGKSKSQMRKKPLSQIGELLAGLQDVRKLSEFTIKEQEATKREVESTKREIERYRFEAEKKKEEELTRREQEKTKQLELQVQLEMDRVRRLELELELGIRATSTVGSDEEE